MNKKMQKTKNQHYIPQMVLKNFSNYSNKTKHKEIFQYDIYKKSTRMVNIKDVCKKRNLYEFKNNNQQQLTNLVEKYFSLYERKWNIVFEKIMNNKKINQEQISYIYLFMILQFLRVPFNINGLTNKIQSDIPYLTNEQATNIVLLNFFNEDIKSINIFKECVEEFSQFQIHIYHSNYPLFINDTHLVVPFIVDPYKKDINEYIPYNNWVSQAFIATISPKCCIVLSNDMNKKIYKKMDNNMAKYINEQYFILSDRFIYMNAWNYQKLNKEYLSLMTPKNPYLYRNSCLEY